MERTLPFGSFLDNDVAEEWMELAEIMGPEVDCDLGCLLTNLCIGGFELLYWFVFNQNKWLSCHSGSLMSTYARVPAPLLDLRIYLGKYIVCLENKLITLYIPPEISCLWWHFLICYSSLFWSGTRMVTSFFVCFPKKGKVGSTLL